MKEVIAEKLQQNNDESSIALTALDIAYIMEHNAIYTLLKNAEKTHTPLQQHSMFNSPQTKEHKIDHGDTIEYNVPI